MKTPRLVIAAVAGIVVLSAAQGEEKNGLSVTLSKKTLDRADQRSGYYFSRIDRTQALKAVIRNVTFKPMPEGELEWTILVRQHSSGAVEKYTGKETLKPLKAAESVELLIGAAQVTGYRHIGTQSKDKIEHRIIITQGGKETFRTQSTAAFEALEKRAITVGRQAAPKK